VRSEGYYVNEKSNDTSWDRTNDPPTHIAYIEYMCICIYIFRNREGHVSILSVNSNGKVT